MKLSNSGLQKPLNIKILDLFRNVDVSKNVLPDFNVLIKDNQKYVFSSKNTCGKQGKVELENSM